MSLILTKDCLLRGGQLEERSKRKFIFPKEDFYVGHIASDPNAHVAVREIDEEKGHLVRK